MDKLYDSVCAKCSELITKNYSTSFSLGIKVFDAHYRSPIYSIYGFVRFADEIVDTYSGDNPRQLLQDFKDETFKAISQKVSLNPVLHSFQSVVNEYKIELELIHAFLYSMEMDLDKSDHSEASYQKYIYGSAEVVGLMCLHVFVGENKSLYNELVPSARALGSAFQKVNFLRDIKSDFEDRGRVYFPDVDFSLFTAQDKAKIESEIQAEFDHAYEGIVKLPKGVKFGVYSAYQYYLSLFNKIKKCCPSEILTERVRIPNSKKLYLLGESALKNTFNML